MTGKQKSLLLIGPTGSGKTPLGIQLESKGILKRKCHHFDFGELLRGTQREEVWRKCLSGRQIKTVQSLLQTGNLLKESQYPIAEGLLSGFLHIKEVKTDDLIVLNGFPRDIKQAQFLEDKLDIFHLIVLYCNEEIIQKRICKNTGGDRVGRMDDSSKMVKKKIALFKERTQPLIKYYKRKGSTILKLHSKVTLSAQAIYRQTKTALASRYPGL